jgi:predicted SAM-dependent methyltransferase
MTKILNVGCGLTISDNAINIDSSFSLLLRWAPIINKSITKFPKEVRYGNIVNGLKYENNYFDIIYCSHMLEHLSKDDFTLAIRELYRITKNGGIFRFVIPDIEYLIKKYSDKENICEFLNESGLGYSKSKKGLINKIIYALTNTKHEWLWSYTELEKILFEVGFNSVRRAYYMDSIYKDELSSIEMPDRWENCLGVECVK